MSVPKKRRTKSSVKKRQSHHSLKKINLSVCPKCQEKILPHTVCPNCGTYKNRTVLSLKIKKSVSKTANQKENNK